PDYFSSLPPELLSDIFEYAYKDSKPPTFPISSSFLPFQRQYLYRQISISSIPQFESLLRTCELNSELGTVVNVLEVENIDSEGGGTRKKNARRITSFLWTLVNLEHLKLGNGSSSLTDLILSYGVSHSTLPRLERISTAVSSALGNTIDSKLYLHLDGYPSLRCLEVSTYNDSLFMSSKGGGPIPNIHELILKVHRLYDDNTLSFIRAFENLSSLTLHCVGSHPLLFFDTVVPFLPISLTSLTLRNDSLDEENPNLSWPIDHHLPRLVNLEYLYLSYGTCSREAVDHLSKLAKIKTLGFGRWAIVDWPDLEDLILGPNRLPSLEKVIFDQVEGEMGWRIWEDSDGLELHPDHDLEEHHVGPGWIIPRGTPGFELKNVGKLIDRIKGKGIIVEGDMINALEVWVLWSWEVMSCEIAYAYKTYDLDEVTATFGDEWVEIVFSLDRNEWQSRGPEIGRGLMLSEDH
ncbi:hypothetical protein JCM3765_000860, partial [Sporobolomyces pararoseus]